MHSPQSLLQIAVLVALPHILAASTTYAAWTLTATASSQTGTLSPAHAVDGDPNTLWSSAGRISPNTTEWLAVDFGEVATVSGVRNIPRLLSGSSLCYPVDYRIDYTADGTTWLTVPDAVYTDQPTPFSVVTHMFTQEIQARGIRIVATRLSRDDFGHYYFQLAEFEPIPSSTVKEIDLGQVVHIAGVQMTPLFGTETYCYPIDYSFEYSYDAAAERWFALNGAVYTNRPEPSGTVIHMFDATVLARRIRLIATRVGPEGCDPDDLQSLQLEPIVGQAVFPLETSNDEFYDAHLNMLWAVYGNFWDAATSADRSTYTFGNEPAWYEWMALKYSWSQSTRSFRDYLRNSLIVPWPQSADGYIWSWSTQEKWPTGEGSYHQENNAKYILGAWRIWSWTRDDGFFDQVDGTSVPSAPRPDVSRSRTMRQKLRDAMRYIEESLQRNLGGIQIEDNGMGNTGTPDGHPTSYWDNWPFGYHDAYTNIYYYAALEAMAQMESYWGDDARAAELRARREGCRLDYFDKFWDATKGRFIACVDTNGARWDFGGTFHNLEALAYGLGDLSKADSVFGWLDGTRLVTGDTSTGADIYRWRFAPRANTRKIESIGPPYWWYSIDGAITVDPTTGNARWDRHLENGGAIFYTSYYDLMARLRWLGADNALARLNVILGEFEVDQLRRDPGVWQLGIIGEFPESGLVPCFLVYGFAGIEPDVDGLSIQPQLPTAWTHLTVRELAWAGTILDVTVRRTRITITSSPASSRTIYVHSLPIVPGETRTVYPDSTGGIRLLLASDGQPGISAADFDRDGDADMADFSLFQACFNGPNRPPMYAGCEQADIDADADVDLTDFALFTACFNGPNREPACSP